MTQTDIPTTIDATETTVDRYLSFWNIGPGAEQQQLAATVFSKDVDHRGPLGARVGVAGMLELSLGFAEQLGGLRFRARTEPAAHHDRVRVQWEALRDEKPFAEGTDVLVLDDSGLVDSVITFLDRAPDSFNPPSD
jgi:hypothetical protein